MSTAKTELLRFSVRHLVEMRGKRRYFSILLSGLVTPDLSSSLPLRTNPLAQYMGCKRCKLLLVSLYLLRYANPPRQLDSHESLGSHEHESLQWTLWKWDFLRENKDRKPKKRTEDKVSFETFILCSFTSLFPSKSSSARNRI